MPTIDRTATMTSDSAPSPNATSASSIFGAGYEAYRAFDKATAEWATNSTQTGTLTYDFGVSPPTWAPTGYELTSQTSARMAKDWTFEGSNNGTDWTVLDTRTSQTAWGTNETRQYTFSNIVNYRYYRLNVSANNGDAILEVDEMTILAPDSTTTSTSTSTSTTSTSSSTSTTSTSTSTTSTSSSTSSSSSSSTSSSTSTTSTSSSTSTTSTSSSTSTTTSSSSSTSTTSTSSTTTFEGYSFRVTDGYES